MADIQKIVLDKYGIDITQENILKLYRLEKEEPTPQEIHDAIEATRKRWNQSINGANEKNAERDKARLAKADRYEAMLNDAKMRKSIYAFYYGGGNKKAQAGGEGNIVGTDFARGYFSLLETSKKIDDEDVKFFFEYYQAERKNKKVILEMLEKEFKVHGVKKNEDKNEDDTDAPEGKKKNENSPLISNLFQEATIISVRKCMDFFGSILQSEEVCQRIPNIKNGFYEFLQMDRFEDVEEFIQFIDGKNKEFFALRQERGTEFIPLVDLFNTLHAVSEYRDVVDNFTEFKLLLKYPSLTPYMYSFVEVKRDTMKGLIDVANREYIFRDDTDFIVNYYKQVYDNFGITNSGIGTLIRKAEKRAKANKLIEKVNEKLGKEKTRKLSLGLKILYALIYWPIVLIYLLFETCKAIITELHRFTIPVFLIAFAGTNIALPKMFGIENLMVLRKIFSPEEWLLFLHLVVPKYITNTVELVLFSIIAVILFAVVYITPAVVIAAWLHSFSMHLNKKYDWVGYERTFQGIFKNIRKTTENKYYTQKSKFIKSAIPKIVINLVLTGIVIAIVHFTPMLYETVAERVDWLPTMDEIFDRDDEISDDIFEDEDYIECNDESNDSIVQNDEEQDVIMIFTGKSSNIRSGPGKENDVVTTAKQGEEFVATGNTQIASNGRTWYEIYLDVERVKTGWASETVIKYKE